MPEGLKGYCISKTERVAYLPVVANPIEGNGAVGRLLAELKESHDVIVVSTVTSPRLAKMLERRSFYPEMHYVQEFGEHAHTLVWRRPGA